MQQFPAWGTAINSNKGALQGNTWYMSVSEALVSGVAHACCHAACSLEKACSDFDTSKLIIHPFFRIGSDRIGSDRIGQQ